jgi:hypothetical protein
VGVVDERIDAGPHRHALEASRNVAHAGGPAARAVDRDARRLESFTSLLAEARGRLSGKPQTPVEGSTVLAGETGPGGTPVAQAGSSGLEGGGSGWKQGLDLLGDRINMVGVKNAGLYPEKDTEGNVRWQGKLIPVWEGLTPFRQAFGFLKQTGFDGPCSFHSEYQGSFSFKDMTTPELIEQTRLDLEYVRKLLAEI